MAEKLHPSPYHGKAPLDSPPNTISLFWRGRYGNRQARYYPDRNEDEQHLLKLVCLIHAGHSPRIELTETDRLDAIAKEYGYTIAYYGDPSDEVRLKLHREAYELQCRKGRV